MTEAHDVALETFTALQRTLVARRVLPIPLQVYTDVTKGEVDWLGLIERVERAAYQHTKMGLSDRAAVGLVAHMLGVPEALRVAPADTFGELLDLVDRDTHTAVLTGLTMLQALRLL